MGCNFSTGKVFGSQMSMRWVWNFIFLWQVICNDERSEVMPLLQKNRHKLNCVEYCWRQSVHSSSAVGLRPSGLEHSRYSSTGYLCVLYGGICFNHYNCRVQNSKKYRALSILSLKPKFTPCLHGITRLMFLCSWMPSFMIIHTNKYIPWIKILLKISIGFEMSYTI